MKKFILLTGTCILTAIYVATVATTTSAEEKPLYINSEGSIVAALDNTSIIVAKDGKITVNGFSSHCSNEVRKEVSPSGDTIKCFGDAIKIIDHHENVLKIAGNIVKLVTKEGKSFVISKDSGGQLDSSKSGQDNFENDEEVSVNESGIKISSGKNKVNLSNGQIVISK